VKYAFRWVPAESVPEGTDLSTLRTKTAQGRTLYRVPNPDLGDLENTIVKMSAKRAEVDATLQLPGMSELFVAAE